MVDLVGIEPTTSSMPWKRAPSCATGPHGYVTFILAEPVYSSNQGTEGVQIIAGFLNIFPNNGTIPGILRLVIGKKVKL